MPDCNYLAERATFFVALFVYLWSSALYVALPKGGSADLQGIRSTLTSGCVYWQTGLD